MKLPNPQELDALLAVLRERHVYGFEITNGVGEKLILQLEPPPPVVADESRPGGPLCEVVEPPAGGWKVPR